MPVGQVIFQQCPGDSQPKLFMFFAQLDAAAPYDEDLVRQVTIYSFNYTALTCTPNHAPRAAFVTTDSAWALIDFEVRNTSDKTVTSS